MKATNVVISRERRRGDEQAESIIHYSGKVLIRKVIPADCGRAQRQSSEHLIPDLDIRPSNLEKDT